MAVKLGLAAANAEATAICLLLNSGWLDIYDGTQPATPDTAISDQHLLASMQFHSTATTSVSNGVATLAVTSPTVQDSSADAAGYPTWFRCWQSNHTTAVFDGSVGLSSADAVIDSSPITQTAVITVNSMTYTANRG